jgi:glycosyltransferase involved in cell wall biosynthesis
MSEMLTSFIIPAKDRASELRMCLASCLCQTYQNWEAIVVDDHSTEDIRQVVRGFNDRRICYIRQAEDRRGVASARQTAIEASQGSILMTLDSDDISHPHRSYNCKELLQGDTPKLIYTRIRFFDHFTGRDRRKPILEPHNPDLLLLFNYITNPGTAFNRKAYEAAGAYYDSSLEVSEDYDLYIRMMKAGVRIEAVDEEHVSYRKGFNSLTFGASSRVAKSVEQIRLKHNVQAFSLERIKELASSALWNTICADSELQEVWKDRRYDQAGSTELFAD